MLYSERWEVKFTYIKKIKGSGFVPRFGDLTIISSEKSHLYLPSRTTEKLDTWTKETRPEKKYYSHFFSGTLYALANSPLGLKSKILHPTLERAVVKIFSSYLSKVIQILYMTL